MKLHGKVIGKRLKEYGKGNGAESSEAGELTIKLTGDIKGRLVIEPPEEEFAEVDIGDVTSFDVPFAQRKLNLNNRAKDRRDRESASAKAH